MAGLIDSFAPQLQAPDHKIVPIDSGTNSLINQGISLAQQTPEQIAAQRLQGVDAAAQQGQQSDQQANQQAAGLGYSGQGMNQAIRNQYNSQAGEQINRLKSAYGQSAQFEKSAMLQQGFAEAQARQNVTMQSYEKLMDAYNQTETARAQMLSSILGAGGSAAGMYAGMHSGGRKSSAAGTKGSAGYLPGGGYADSSSMPGQRTAANNMDVEGLS